MLSIAIDGPSGAGKSTISRLVSQKIGFIYVDTGALYRTIALYMLENGIDTADGDAVTANLGSISIETKHIDGMQRMFLNGRDVSDDIRRPELSLLASAVSAIPSVRAFLLETQRDFARKNNVIMDGRDIGTTVLPDADLKIYLTATAEDRANRRYLEQKEKGFDVDYDSILADINKRDYNDSHRAVSPLTKAPDAVLVDTTGNELEKSIRILHELIISELKLEK
ncbi:MAG: (d)CMP kinase [Oscillospiraceae bacterium]|nr:(d)CMP kinase [Oscillospiraceae bacterium]MBQ9938525.1 (d)CMP kinase [Oscillospiraceae bacterium]